MINYFEKMLVEDKLLTLSHTDCISLIYSCILELFLDINRSSCWLLYAEIDNRNSVCDGSSSVVEFFNGKSATHMLYLLYFPKTEHAMKTV